MRASQISSVSMYHNNDYTYTDGLLMLVWMHSLSSAHEYGICDWSCTKSVRNECKGRAAQVGGRSRLRRPSAEGAMAMRDA